MLRVRFISVNTEETRDVVIFNDADRSFLCSTGRARDLVEGRIAVIGYVRAFEQFRDGWSNGYVRTEIEPA